MTWKPLGEPQEIGAGLRQYVQSSHHHEGGHYVELDGHTLLVLPDGRTTPRNRSQAIADALQATAAVEGVDRVSYLIGRLVRIGATNLRLDGDPLLPEPATPAGQWVVELRGDGSVDARYLGAEGRR